LPDIKDGLAVGRADLEHALGIVTGSLPPQVRGVTLSYDEQWLYLKTRTTLARATAKGVWPVTIIVPVTWAKRLVRSLPEGDPIVLHVEGGRLYTNKFSVPCEWSAEDEVLDPRTTGNKTVKHRLHRAAEILKPFRVEEDELRRLMIEAGKRGTPAWSDPEQKVIAAVSKAWAVLGPLGIETLRLRVDSALSRSQNSSRKQGYARKGTLRSNGKLRKFGIGGRGPETRQSKGISKMDS